MASAVAGVLVQTKSPLCPHPEPMVVKQVHEEDNDMGEKTIEQLIHRIQKS